MFFTLLALPSDDPRLRIFVVELALCFFVAPAVSKFPREVERNEISDGFAAELIVLVHIAVEQVGRNRLGIGHETMVPRQGHGAGADLIPALQSRYAIVPSEVLAFEKAVAIIDLRRERPTPQIGLQTAAHHPEVMHMCVVVAKVEVAEEAAVDIGHKTLRDNGVREVVGEV